MEIVIIKLSGKAIDSFIADKKWIKILSELRSSFDGVLIVHGAGNKITEWSELLNYGTIFYQGQRVTDSKIIEVAAAVQAGLINSKITGFLQSRGFCAAGHTGCDRGLFSAEYFDRKLGFVGKPKLNGSTKWLLSEMADGVIPVYSSICSDHNGNLMNVNADLFTKAIAESVNASAVLFFSDISCVKLGGKMQNKLSQPQIKSGIDSGDIYGGMIPKLNSCLDLLACGIKKVWIGNNPDDVNFIGRSKSGTWIVNG